MSLGGLAVAIGLIIDDAVVVVENIERRLALHPGTPARETIREATDEIFAPVAGSTLTTVVVFAPLGLLEGVVGQFFRSFSLALASAVILSLVLALTLIPLLAERLHRASAAEEAKQPWATRALGKLLDRYEPALGALLSRRRLAYGLIVGTVLVMLVAARNMGTGFLPEMDEGGFILDYWTPTGSSLAETDRELNHLEAILRADPDVQAFTRRTGSELGFFATSPNRGDLTVRLRARSERTSSVYVVMDRVRTRVESELPGVRIEFVQILQDLIGDLAGLAEPVELKVFHPDLATAERAARTVAAAVEPVPGLVDLFDGVQGTIPESRVDLDPVRVSRLGLTIADVADQTRGALFGAPAGAIREADRLIPIRVRLEDADRFAPRIVRTLPIVGPDGWAPLGDLGVVHDTADAAELTRENLRPVVRVTGAVDLSRVEPRLGHAGRAPGDRGAGASGRRNPRAGGTVCRAEGGVPPAPGCLSPGGRGGPAGAGGPVPRLSRATRDHRRGPAWPDRGHRGAGGHRHSVQCLQLHGIDPADRPGGQERHHLPRCRHSTSGPQASNPAAPCRRPPASGSARS